MKISNNNKWIIGIVVTVLLTVIGWWFNSGGNKENKINNSKSSTINNAGRDINYSVENSKIQDLYFRTHIEVDGIKKPVLINISFFNPGDYNHEIESIFLEIQNIKENGRKRWILPNVKMPFTIKSKDNKTIALSFVLSQSDINKIFYLKIDGYFVRGPIEYGLLIEFFDKRGNKHKKTIKLARLDSWQLNDGGGGYMYFNPDSSYVLIRDK